jgi:preprotein translocase subunit YajC
MSFTNGFFALQAAPSGGISGTGFLIQMAAIAAIFYFLMIRPQQRQRKQHEEQQRNLHKGDSIVTSGGIVGEVVHVKETVKDGAPAKSMDDLVTIRTGDVRLIVERRAIARITTATGAAATPAARSDA